MNCTSCNNGNLVPSFIEGLFRAHTCDQCGGNWILIVDFVSWKERNPQYQFTSDVSFEADDVTDTKAALICPISRTIMRKFKITAEHEHRLDYSSATGGLWLDKGEWELLKQEGIAGCLNAVVTQNWQRWIRQDSAKQTFTDSYRARFGDDVYEKVKDMRMWLLSQEQKADLRAYLLAEDPYSAEK